MFAYIFLFSGRTGSPTPVRVRNFSGMMSFSSIASGLTNVTSASVSQKPVDWLQVRLLVPQGFPLTNSTEEELLAGWPGDVVFFCSEH